MAAVSSLPRLPDAAPIGYYVMVEIMLVDGVTLFVRLEEPLPQPAAAPICLSVYFMLEVVAARPKDALLAPHKKA